MRGRSQSLRINYRTSHQIRTQADRLLDPELSDVDGNTEERKGTVSVFNGPSPTVWALDGEEAESLAVGEWLKARVDDGLEAEEISVFVRSHEQLDRAVAAVKHAGLQTLYSTAVWGPWTVPLPSARCTWPRGWSSGQLR